MRRTMVGSMTLAIGFVAASILAVSLAAVGNPSSQSATDQLSTLASQDSTEFATVTTESNLRAEPNTISTVLTVMPAGTPLEVVCWTQGEPTYGTDKYGSMWLHTTQPGWVHSFLVTPVDVPECDPSMVTVPPAAGESDSPLPPYENCDEAREANDTPVPFWHPRYGPHLDRDNDGIGCE